MFGTTDLDGRPRVVGSTVDVGAYEFPPGVSGVFIGWLQHYGLLTDGSADFADADADGINNWLEWVCGTCPTSRLSALCLLSATPQGTHVAVNWQSVAGVNYFLARSANLASPWVSLHWADWRLDLWLAAGLAWAPGRLAALPSAGGPLAAVRWAGPRPKGPWLLPAGSRKVP